MAAAQDGRMGKYKIFTATKSTTGGFEAWLNRIYDDGYEVISVVPTSDEDRYRVVAKLREK